MSTDKKEGTHAAAWIVSIIAVGVVYLGSYGPVEGLGLVSAGSPDFQGWLLDFYRPYYLLRDHTSLLKPLSVYETWCIQTLHKP